jgi:four helix bundle protein
MKNMKVGKFEEIQVWKKAKDFTLKIYRLFSNCKDFGFKEQIQRASVSIMNNIAEGFERKGNKEFKKFLYIAKGSCAEIRSMLYLADELKYINKSEFEELFKLSVEISKMLSGFIKTL